jgi:hypothetical protein
MSTSKAAKPELYSGEGDPLLVDSWLNKMARYLRLSDTPEHKKVDTAATYLSGRAYEWFDNNEATCTSFDIFKINLRNFIVPANFTSVLLDKFLTLKQGSRSVQEYANAMQSLQTKISDLVQPNYYAKRNSRGSYEL